MQNKVRKSLWHSRLWKFFVVGIIFLSGFVFVFLWFVNQTNVYCADWEGRARIWVDENENGLFEATEPLLENVTLTIAHSESPSKIVWEVITDKWGSAELSFPTSGSCGSNLIMITAITPIGYRPTTSLSLQTEACVAMSLWTKEMLCDPGPFYFGFVRE